MSGNDVFVANSIYPDAKQIFTLAVKPIDEIKDSCIFVIDTNALLVPYTASSEGLDQIRSVYSALIDQNRLVIPGQVAREFAKNWPEKIKEIFQQLNDEKSKTHKLSTKNYPLLKNIQEYQDALEIEKQINGLIREYGQKIYELQNKIRGWTWNDPVSAIYNQLFVGDVIFELKIDKDVIEKELSRRYEQKIPPGYKDGGKQDAGIGDLLIWYSILEVARERNSDVIFVSGDEKTDWFYQSVGQPLYPRFELVMEFTGSSGGKSFHIIKLSEFLNLQGVDRQVIQEVEEIEEVQSFNRWVDEVVNTFEALGGKAELQEVYNHIEATTTRDLPEAWKPTIRNAIQIHSSDSESYRGGRDLFRRLSRGHWALRDYVDDEENGEEITEA